MKHSALLDVLKEPTPICGSIVSAVACFPLGAGRRYDVIEVFDQQGYCIRDELFGFVLADVREVLMFDRPGLTAKPCVGFSTFRMCSVGDDLLPVRQELELLIGVAVGCNDIGGNFLERRVRSQRDRALRCKPHAYEHTAALLKPFACQFFDRVGGVGVQDVDVEGGGEPGEHSGVGGVGPCSFPII